MKRLVLLGLLVLLSGCIRDYFQPIADPIDLYSKSGYSKVDVGKAALECGMNDPYMSGAFGYSSDSFTKESMNAYALAELCLLKSGFHRSRRRNVGTMCEAFPEENLPACQPGAVIPKRDVNRRLKGRYCRLELDYEFCKKNAKLTEKCGEPPHPACLP